MLYSRTRAQGRGLFDYLGNRKGISFDEDDEDPVKNLWSKGPPSDTLPALLLLPVGSLARQGMLRGKEGQRVVGESCRGKHFPFRRAYR